MRHYRDYSDEDVVKNAKEVKSISGLLRSLGLVTAGGNFANMKKTLQRLKVDTSHWTGQGWSKGQQLKDWSEYTKAVRLKPHLIKKRGHCCEKCNRKTWRGEKVPLEIHHLDSDRTNNEEFNLELLCCNCHAITPDWRGRKKKAPVAQG
jgi:hypothetical protein